MASAKIQSPLPSTAKARLPQLDILRAVAVLLVMFRHSHHIMGADPGVFPLSYLHRGGWIGVDLFFVLSGFLISGLLFREYQRYGRISYKRFVIRRGLKIYPAFYVFLILLLPIRLPHLGWLQKLPLTLSEIFFVQNYVPNLWVHTWSLAVEEHFYLATPLVLIAIYTIRRNVREDVFRTFVPIALAIMVVTLLIRLSVGDRPFEEGLHYQYTHVRLDGLTFGVLLSYLHHYHPSYIQLSRRKAVSALLVAACCLLPNFLFDLVETPFIYTWGFTFNYIGAGLLLIALLSLPVAEGRFAKALASTGAYSYSLYLWHVPIAVACGRMFDTIATHLQGGVTENWLLLFRYSAFFVYFPVTVVVGILMAKLVEIPVLNIRDRFFPSRSGLTALAANAGDRREPMADPRAATTE